MHEFHLRHSHILFDHPWVKFIKDTLEYQGQEIKYYYLASPMEAVATVGLTSDGLLILTRQYRHPVGQIIYDLPAGRMEPGESPLEAARREFEEETGFFPDHIEHIGYYNQFPGSLRAATHLFFASDLHPTGQHLDEGEVLELAFKPVAEVMAMILNGDVLDGSLQLGILLALHKGLLRI